MHSSFGPPPRVPTPGVAPDGGAPAKDGVERVPFFDLSTTTDEDEATQKTVKDSQVGVGGSHLSDELLYAPAPARPVPTMSEEPHAPKVDAPRVALSSTHTNDSNGGARPPLGVGDGQPEWVQSLFGAMQSLHDKQDTHHRDVLGLALEVDRQGNRVDLQEKATSEHTTVVTAHQLQIEKLTHDVASLKEQFQQHASRSPTPQRNHTPPRQRSMSPRTIPSPKPDRQSLSLEDFDVVVGGWQDARKTDAETEVKNLFEAVGLASAWKDLFTPYSRTSFMRVRLNFPDEEAPVYELRRFQTEVINKLKEHKWTSGVEGSKDKALWVTRHRSPEERQKVRALVVCKEFLQHVPNLPTHPKQRMSPPEIDWRGKVFAGNLQFLGHMDTENPDAYDQMIEDSRGNHTPWFVRADKFAEYTGHDASKLQAMWLDLEGTTNRINRRE